MIVIIGGGPIGCYLGEKLARAGKDVSIYEEHSVIGKPVQCTGIVTKDISKFVELKKEFIVGKVDRVRVFSKNNRIELPINDIVLNREKFDKYLASKAKKAGANIYLNHKYIGIKGRNAVFADKKNKIKKVEAEYIIGADGPLSDVAKSNKMFGKRSFYIGMQARVKGKWDKGCYETYFGSIAPGFFAWILPESDKIARVGIAARMNVRDKFNKFLDVKSIKKKQIIDIQAGVIPIFDKKSIIQKENVFLVGDAAEHVKATTGGGLVPGLKAAKILANSIIRNKSYKKELRKLNKELWIHLKIRRILNKFSDKDYNKLLKLMKNRKISSALRKTSRDNSKKLIFKSIIAEPRLLLFTTKFIK